MSEPDDDIRAAVEAIPDADPEIGESLTQNEDGSGSFLIESETDDQDVDEIDEALDDAGYERDGLVEAPGMTQQFYRPIEEDEDDE